MKLGGVKECNEKQVSEKVVFESEEHRACVVDVWDRAGLDWTYRV